LTPVWESILKDVTDKVVLVTGGSKGLGRQLAARFARVGAKVVLWARTQADLDRAVDEFRCEGWQAWAHSVDVTDIDRVMEAAAQVKEDVGPVDVLVNNAGFVCGGHAADARATIPWRRGPRGCPNNLFPSPPAAWPSPRSLSRLPPRSTCAA